MQSGKARPSFQSGIKYSRERQRVIDSNKHTIDVRAMLTPVVYAWKRGDEYLYIGFTSCLYRRFGGHHVIGKRDELKPTDQFDVWYFRSRREARAFELRMIAHYHPKFN
jgi:predicted GIY-YIG superfamily endonuclease